MTLRINASAEPGETPWKSSNKATGWPFEVITRLSLPAELSNSSADFFLRSAIEIVLTRQVYVVVHSAQLDYRLNRRDPLDI